jgi:hypothetical protein
MTKRRARKAEDYSFVAKENKGGIWTYMIARRQIEWMEKLPD